MGKWHKKQPSDGDVVLHCGHLDHGSDMHWWRYEPRKMSFRRPDGTQAEARWQVACVDCFDRAAGDPQRITIRGDAVWEGDEPVIPASD